MANGLRVPRAFADREILSVLRESEGDAVAVSDDEMVAMVARLGASEGIYPAPEAAATLVAAARMVADGRIDGDETVLTFLTGNAYKYQESLPVDDG
jgi:threonine synthase